MIPNPPKSDPTKDRIVCYATDKKIGVQMLPLDGNPHRSIAVLGHPDGIQQLCCSNDSNHVFTTSNKNSTIQMWTINKKLWTVCGGQFELKFFVSVL